MLGRNGSTGKVYSASYPGRSVPPIKILIALPFFVAMFAFSLYISERSSGAPYSAHTGLLKYVVISSRMLLFQKTNDRNTTSAVKMNSYEKLKETQS